MAPLSVCLDDLYFIYIKWPIGRYVKGMLEKHPDWTIYQAQNILYWQPAARKLLQAEVDKFLLSYPNYEVMGRKEHLDSWGIDMTESCKQIGINLEWGTSWGLRSWTYLLRYAGIPVASVSKDRIAKLAKDYPAIYSARTGRCSDCNYRPCLRHIVSYPEHYAHRKWLGGFATERFVPDVGWIVKCENCGKKRMAPIDKPLCLAFVCSCSATKTPAGKRGQ
jgi:hypothetical protein